jgi:DNA repair protein RecN (Recombination protein N)
MEEIEGLNANDESIERLGEELAAFARTIKRRPANSAACASRQPAAGQRRGAGNPAPGHAWRSLLHRADT